MKNPSLRQALLDLPDNAPEPVVDSIFMPEIFKALGFDLKERVPKYATGNGNDKVDYAARHNISSDIFLQSKSSPYLLVELKGRDINLIPNSATYKSTVKQIHRYLLAQNCQTVQWGIITNSACIQIFRKHGKVIHPASPCMEITPNNVTEIIEKIRHKIETPPKALTVAIYNNKGGVGKTTTTVNLAAVLALMGKKSLIVDFDPHQKDLTNSLGIKPDKDALYSCLANKKGLVDIKNVIHTYKVENKSEKKVFKFDILPADEKFGDLGEDNLRQEFKLFRLWQILERLRSEYDYILIDSPPNWKFLSQSAIYASDVVLIPTKHNNIFSLENAALAIRKFIPSIQEIKKDGSPIALPIFFNGEKIGEAARKMANEAIEDIIKNTLREHKFDLRPYFHPHFTPANKDLHIFDLPNYANIANAAFSRMPAAYKNKTAHDYYKNLAKEYFIQ